MCINCHLMNERRLRVIHQNSTPFIHNVCYDFLISFCKYTEINNGIQEICIPNMHTCKF